MGPRVAADETAILIDRTHLEPNLPDLLVNVSVGGGDSDVTVVVLCGHDIVHLFEVASLLKHGDGAVFLVPSLAVRGAGTLVLGVGLKINKLKRS